MKLTREERIQLTYQIGDIIEQKCRRCYYNRSDDASFSINICANCPTGQELRQLGRYFDTEPRQRRETWKYSGWIDASPCERTQ